MAITLQNASGLCQPLRLTDPKGPRSTLYQWKKLKIRSTTPETAVVDLARCQFLEVQDLLSFCAVRPALGHIGN